MSNIKTKFLNRMFRKIGDLVWDLSSGKLGIRSPQGIFTLDTSGDAPQVVVNPFDAFGFDIPAFALATKIEDIQVGDIVVGDTKILGFVVDKTAASLTLLDQSGMKKNYTPPKVAVLDVGSNVLVVKNLFNLVGGEGLAGLQGNLMPLLMLGGDLDLDGILPFLLFSQTSGTGQAGVANLLPLLMLSKTGVGGGDIDPMMLMAMSGGLGGSAGGMNPMMLAMLLGRDGEGRKTTIDLPLRAATPPLTRV